MAPPKILPCSLESLSCWSVTEYSVLREALENETWSFCHAEIAESEQTVAGELVKGPVSVSF